MAVAGDASKNPVITVTSTLRPPRRQAKAMYNNLAAGQRIAYAAPGREVVAIYDSMKKAGASGGDILDAMERRIIELAEVNKLVSRHCVTEAQYERENIIDVSKWIPNPRDFVKALIRDKRVTKVITPFSSDYNDSRVAYDSNEPAIHIEYRVWKG